MANAVEDTATENDDDFEKAFNEYSSGKPADDDEEISDADEQETESASDDGEDLQDEEEAPADPWAEAPEPLRNEYVAAKNDIAALMHRAKSDSGRIAALQKKLDELTQQTHKDEKPATEKQKHEAQELSDKWAELAEDYPEIAAAIESRLAAIDKKISTSTGELDRKFQETVEPIREAEKAHYIQSQLAALNAAHPDWKQVKSSKGFEEWFGAQPPSVQALRKSDAAEDAAYLISAYKRDKQETSQKLDRIERSRTERMASAVSTRGTGNAPKPTPPDDFEAAFNAYVAADERKARRRA